MRKNTMPSLAALLGLLAVAGYQNRDKIGDFLNTHMKTGATPLPGAPADATAASGGGILGGLKGVVDSFRNAGDGEAADSWVATGPNAPVTPAQTETALGGDLIDTLAKQTGLSREDLLKRLSQVLPEAVDKMSPGGQLPAA